MDILRLFSKSKNGPRFIRFITNRFNKLTEVDRPVLSTHINLQENFPELEFQIRIYRNRPLGQRIAVCIEVLIKFLPGNGSLQRLYKSIKHTDQRTGLTVQPNNHGDDKFLGTQPSAQLGRLRRGVDIRKQH